MLIEVIGRGFSNRFFRRLFMLIDFSLFRRCGPGRNDTDRFFLAHHAQQRAVASVRCIQLLHLVLHPRQLSPLSGRTGRKKTSQASWKVTLCLRRLIAAFSESHSKVCPRSSSLMSTNHSVYTLHVRVKRLDYSCARRARVRVNKSFKAGCACTRERGAKRGCKKRLRRMTHARTVRSRLLAKRPSRSPRFRIAGGGFANGLSLVGRKAGTTAPIKCSRMPSVPSDRTM